VEIRLANLSFASLAKAALLINFASWLVAGAIMAGLEASGIPVLDPEIPPVPTWERVLVTILAGLLIGAAHTILLLPCAWIVRAAVGGLKLRVRGDGGMVSRRFE
jgi:hypothetical protein